MTRNITERRGKERRCARRFNETLLAFYRNTDMVKAVSGHTEDVSLSGLKIISETLFSPREKIDIELYLPRDKSRKILNAIVLTCEVCWTERMTIVKNCKVLKGFGMGVHILGAGSENFEQMHSYLKLLKSDDC